MKGGTGGREERVREERVRKGRRIRQGNRRGAEVVDLREEEVRGRDVEVGRGEGVGGVWRRVDGG